MWLVGWFRWVHTHTHTHTHLAMWRGKGSDECVSLARTNIHVLSFNAMLITGKITGRAFVRGCCLDIVPYSASYGKSEPLAKQATRNEPYTRAQIYLHPLDSYYSSLDGKERWLLAKKGGAGRQWLLGMAWTLLKIKHKQMTSYSPATCTHIRILHDGVCVPALSVRMWMTEQWPMN